MHETFRSYWYGGALPPYACMCINSYLKHGHEFILYTHTGVENPPNGCVVEDAEPILPIELAPSIGAPAGNIRALSDWFRYRMLYKYGGWWVDTDACLAPGARVPQGDYIFFKEMSVSAANGIFKVPKECSLMERMISVFERLREYKPWYDRIKEVSSISHVLERASDEAAHELVGKWNVGGPRWFLAGIQEEGLEKYMVPYKPFGSDNLCGDQALCDGWSTITALYNGQFSLEKDILPRMWNIHLYGSMCTRNRFWERKWPNSVVDQLDEIYGHE